MNKDLTYRLIISTLWLVVFAAASQVMIVAPILPRIGEALVVEQSSLGLLMTVYAVGVGMFALIAGPISDRFGRRKILLFGAGAMAVALGLHGFADTFASLLTVRFLAGSAGGILSGAAISYVGDYFPVNKRGWASGWVMSGIAAGQIAGIPLGNLLADWLGYKTPFLAFAVVAGIAWVLIKVRLPQPDVELADRLSISGALRGYGRLLKRSEVRAAAASFVMMFMGISLYVTFFPTWLERDLHFSAAMVSLLYFVGGSANVLIGPQAGRLSDKIGRPGVIIVASIGIAVIMPLIALLDSGTGWMVFPLFFITMGLVASRMSPLQALLTQLTSGSQRGALMSLVTSIGQIGFGLGSAFATVTWDAWGFPGTALVSTASVLLMAWIVWQFLRHADRRDTEFSSTDEAESQSVETAAASSGPTEYSVPVGSTPAVESRPRAE